MTLEPPRLSIWLWGGPLDGCREDDVSPHCHALTWTDSGLYTYCPAASLRLQRTTFVHETVRRFFCHP